MDKTGNRECQGRKRSYKCEVCNRKLYGKAQLKLHSEVIHGIQEQAPTTISQGKDIDRQQIPKKNQNKRKYKGDINTKQRERLVRTTPRQAPPPIKINEKVKPQLERF